jgi:hypothetical protein
MFGTATAREDRLEWIVGRLSGEPLPVNGRISKTQVDLQLNVVVLPG